MKRQAVIISVSILAIAGALIVRRAILASDTTPRKSPAVLLLSVTNDTMGQPLARLLFTNNTPSKLKRSIVYWGYCVSNRWINNQPLTPTLVKDLAHLDWLEPGGGTLASVHFPTGCMWKLHALFKPPEALQNRGLILQTRKWFHQLLGNRSMTIHGGSGYNVEGPAIYSGFRPEARDDHLLDATAQLLLFYMQGHGGAWPRGWEEVLRFPACRDYHSRLRDVTEGDILRYHGRPDDLKQYIEVDWQADPYRFKAEDRQGGRVAPALIRLRHATSATGVEKKANQRLYDYIGSRQQSPHDQSTQPNGPPNSRPAP